ncbi:MAG: NAD kinase [Bacteroidales bacterium]|nr:NAD kinase [Bacteroidales bacterium]
MKKVGVFGSRRRVMRSYLIKRMFDTFQRLGIEVYVDKDYYEALSAELGETPYYNGLIESDDFDLDIALSIGGDGTFLRTAARIGNKEIPILGINEGRLGFLTDINRNDLEDAVEDIFKNYFRVEERSLLQLCPEGAAQLASYNFALNEVALLKRDTSSMLSIHTYIGEDYLTTYQADGLIVATPTGSTAYSLSVNGPIIMPTVNNLVLSPIAPHSLNVRPLVIPDDCIIKVRVESRSSSFLVALDGRSEVFPAGIEFCISRAPYTTKVIKRYSQTFFKTLSDKLMWGIDSRQPF